MSVTLLISIVSLTGSQYFRFINGALNALRNALKNALREKNNNIFLARAQKKSLALIHLGLDQLPEKTYPDWLFSKFSHGKKYILHNYRANGTITLGYRGGREGVRGRGRGQGRGNGSGGYTSNKRKIQQLEQEIDDIRSQGVPEQVDGQRSAISQVTTTGGSVMGGRADQVRQRTGRGRGDGRD